MRGVQTPRLEHIPPYVSTSGDEAIELCEMAGLHLDEWQQYVLRHSLGEREDGKWACFELGLIVPRQNGKGSILEARELAGLFLLGEKLILHSAHEFKTSQEAFRRVLGLIQNTPLLMKRVHKVSTSHGEEGIELSNGQRLRFVARSKSSARGFTADCIILDEAFNLTNETMAALAPTLSAVPNPQLWYTSSAGMEVSDTLRNLRERGMDGGEEAGSLGFFEWSVDKSAHTDDVEAWRTSNPAMGYRITEEVIRNERRTMGNDGEQQFRRERLGIWFDESSLIAIPLEQWERLLKLNSKPAEGAPLVMAVDMPPERTSAAISIAVRNGDGDVHVECVDHRPGQGTKWVLPRILELNERHKPAAWVLDPAGPVGGLLPSVQEQGIEPIVVTSREHAHGCGQFVDFAMNSQMAHLGQDSMTNALVGGRQRPVGDSWSWHRKDSKTDISPLVAATLAVYGLMTFESEPDVTPGAFFM